MCGIVGFTGKQSAAPILLDGLKKLEYRGYDSAGIAVMNEHRISVSRPGMGQIYPEPPASVIPAGRPTARPQKKTLIRI